MTDTIKPNVTKELDQFSRDLCHQLAANYGEKYLRTEVIYGFSAFLGAVVEAVKKRDCEPEKRSGL